MQSVIRSAIDKWAPHLVIGVSLLVFIAIAAVSAAQQAKATLPQPTAMRSADDVEGIKKAARDYGDGWYEGDAERMERALHPELAKRIVFTRPKSGRSGFSQQGAMSLVSNTRRGGGKNARVEKRPAKVTILDIFENAAVVRVDGPEWVDYLHMAKWNGRWVIVNVLWEPRPQHRDRLNQALSGC